MLSELMMNIHV